jgi:hypothetical protein
MGCTVIVATPVRIHVATVRMSDSSSQVMSCGLRKTFTQFVISRGQNSASWIRVPSR